MGVQLLMNQIFSLPTTSNQDGVFATLPEPVNLLPRSKPLPKPKPETKWVKFARAKGIDMKTKKDAVVFDEEKQDWVKKWGYKGKNKEVEDQWIVEVPANKPADFDPVKESKQARQERKKKNLMQQQKNLVAARKAEAAANKKPSGVPELTGANKELQSDRKSALHRQLRSTRTATASLGKFDTTLKNEEQLVGKKNKNMKRKFEPVDVDASTEREGAMKILKLVERGDVTQQGKGKGKGKELVNARKAIRATTGGRGAAALVGSKESGLKKGSKRR